MFPNSSVFCALTYFKSLSSKSPNALSKLFTCFNKVDTGPVVGTKEFRALLYSTKDSFIILPAFANLENCSCALLAPVSSSKSLSINSLYSSIPRSGFSSIELK